ncbi:DUF488 domain-containing protein [Parvibaculum sp.]|uniref:DUF488 domain-containing protein n=1 Tax=Parvibaculum sp. TaxID=2024848 RepID=UPI00320F67FF
MKLATIGYERRTLAELLERLKAAKVDTLIDVRAVAASRRAGFSKTILAASLKEAGIDYVHLRALGTPKDGRIAVRAGRFDEMREIYEKHLEEPAAQLELLRATEIVQTHKAALLCFEADFAHCHRAIVADRIRDAIGCKIENL